jgi:hypothetical protein
LPAHLAGARAYIPCRRKTRSPGWGRSSFYVCRHHLVMGCPLEVSGLWGLMEPVVVASVHVAHRSCYLLGRREVVVSRESDRYVVTADLLDVAVSSSITSHHDPWKARVGCAVSSENRTGAYFCTRGPEAQRDQADGRDLQGSSHRDVTNHERVTSAARDRQACVAVGSRLVHRRACTRFRGGEGGPRASPTPSGAPSTRAPGPAPGFAAGGPVSRPTADVGFETRPLVGGVTAPLWHARANASRDTVARLATRRFGRWWLGLGAAMGTLLCVSASWEPRV